MRAISSRKTTGLLRPPIHSLDESLKMQSFDAITLGVCRENTFHR
jgi:hypothetical protein